MPTWISGGASITEPIVVAYSESESNDGASVVLRCPWDDRWAIVGNIFDYGLLWPYMESTGWLPTSFTMGGVQQSLTGKETGEELNTYGICDITLQFGDPESGEKREQGTSGYPGGSTDHEALYYESYGPSGEMIKLPPYIQKSFMFSWNSSLGTISTLSATQAIAQHALDSDEAPTRLVIGLMYVVRWVGLEEVPEDFFTAVDHVNEDEIVSSAGRTFAPETLLCQSPTISRVVAADGSTSTWECEARFAYREAGWNKWFNPKTNAFQPMYRYIYDADSDSFDTVAEFKNFPTTSFEGMLP
jgi:hypothetical protein